MCNCDTVLCLHPSFQSAIGPWESFCLCRWNFPLYPPDLKRIIHTQVRENVCIIPSASCIIRLFFFPFSKKSSSVGHSAWPALTHNLPRLLWPTDRISWHAAMSRNCAVLVTFSGTLVGPVPRHKVGQNYHCVSTITMIWSSGSPGHQRNTFFFGLINRAKQSVNVRHDSKLWMAKQHLLPTVQPHT